MAQTLEISSPADDVAVEQKARQILDGARQVFLAQGFDAASVNDIARAAGVSKGTIYTHFESKEALFEVLIREERKQQAERICKLDVDNPDIASVLFAFGRDLMRLMLSPGVVAQVRTVMAAAPKFPRLAKTFYESGPQHGHERTALYLAKQAEAGRLAVPDPTQAAAQFIQLCQGDIYKKTMFCVVADVDAVELDATVAAAVETFMKAYAPRV